MEKMQILFKEYDTLRQEIVGRLNGGRQLVAIGVAGMAGVITFLGPAHRRDAIFWGLLCGLGTVLGVLFWSTHHSIARVGTRLREIEAEINALAGEDLLKWETRFGGGLSKWFFSRKRQKDK